MGTNITTTEKKGLTVAQVGGNEIYKQLHLIQDLIAIGKLGDEYARLFAEPQEYEGSIDWWYAEEGNPVRVMELPPEERQPVLCRFREMIGILQNYAATLRAQKKNPAYRGHADILEHAVIIPNLDCLYAVDGNPVLVCWGFWEGDSDLVEEARKLIRQIDTTIADDAAARPAIQKEREGLPDTHKREGDAPSTGRDARGPASSGTPPVAGIGEQLDPASATPGSAAAPGTDAGEAPGVVGSVPQEAPARSAGATQPGKKSSSRLPLLVLLALIVLALALAAWYFLKSKPRPSSTPDTSLAFLKGDVNAKGVLSNESGEDVDLRLHFAGEDGKGVSYITEKTQTCQGTVTARASADNTVTFALSELRCPNRNHYEPFSLVCVRGSTSCTGTNKNGETYQVEVSMEGEQAQ